jgi:hypothetical protein
MHPYRTMPPAEQVERGDHGSRLAFAVLAGLSVVQVASDLVLGATPIVGSAFLVAGVVGLNATRRQPWPTSSI